MRSKGISSLSPQALEALREAGRNIKMARVLRGISRRELGLRIQISEPTIAALEAGKPSVSLGALAAVLSALGLESQLAEFILPGSDPVGLAIQRDRLPRAARAPQEL